MLQIASADLYKWFFFCLDKEQSLLSAPIILINVYV